MDNPKVSLELLCQRFQFLAQKEEAECVLYKSAGFAAIEKEDTQEIIDPYILQVFVELDAYKALDAYVETLVHRVS